MIPAINQPVSTGEDLQAVLDFLRHNRAREQMADFPSLADLQEMLGDPGIRIHTVFWRGLQGQVVCYAMIDPSSSTLVFEAQNGSNKGGLEEAAIEWSLHQVKGINLPDPVEIGCADSDPAKQERLVAAGFQRLANSTLRFERSLDGNLLMPDIPEGILIRPLKGESELEEIVALHRLVCGSDQMTIAYRRAMMHAPGYLAEGDLVAVDATGRLAGYCTCWIGTEENRITGRQVGFTDPLGTRPDVRRKGLARALVLNGCHFLQSQGMLIARTSTSSENNAAQAVFRSAEYELVAAVARFAYRG